MALFPHQIKISLYGSRFEQKQLIFIAKNLNNTMEGFHQKIIYIASSVK